MARYDRVDEAVIHARPEDVWSALWREFLGQTHWWLPELGFRLLPGRSELGVGAEVEVTPAAGRDRRGRFSFVAHAVEVKPNERLRSEYTGAFVGSGTWTLERIAEGTRLRMHWQVRTCGFLPTLIALFVDMGEEHSHAMRTGFRRLDALLTAEGKTAEPL
jgi:hypothetical protein